MTDAQPAADPRPGPLARALLRVRRWWLWMAPGEIPVMSAALAYRTVFALIPLLVIALLILRLVDDSEAFIRKLLAKALSASGLEQVIVSGAGASEEFIGPPGPAAENHQLQQWLETVTKGFSSLSFAGIGVVSALTLVYAAVGMLIEVEKAFNAVTAAPVGRSWAGRIMRYWLIVSLGPVLIYASFLAGERFSAMAAGVAEATGGFMRPALVALAGYVVSVGISGVLLVALYTTVPTTRLMVRSALVGALFAAVGLELAKFGFGLYVQHAAARSLYGSLATAPLFLMWIYLTWFIVLAGLRVAFITQHRRSALALLSARAGAAGGLASIEGEGLAVDPHSVVVILAELAHRFAAGKGGANAAELASTTGLDLVFVRRALHRCEREGILSVGASHRRAGSFVLLLPPDKIMVADLYRIGRSLCQRPMGIAAAELFDRAGDRAAAAHAGRTLADEMTGGEASAGG